MDNSQTTDRVYTSNMKTINDRFLIVGDQRVPNGRHCELNSWTGIKLVAIQLGQNLVEIRRQLLTRLLCYCTETHCCSLHIQHQQYQRCF